MYSFPKTCKYIEKGLYLAGTCLKQANFDYPLGACLIHVGCILYSSGELTTFTLLHSYNFGLSESNRVKYMIHFVKNVFLVNIHVIPGLTLDGKHGETTFFSYQ